MPVIFKGRATMKKRRAGSESAGSTESDPDDPEEASSPTVKRRSSARLQNSTKKPRFVDEHSHSSSEEDPFAGSDSDSSIENARFSKGKSKGRSFSKPSSRGKKIATPKPIKAKPAMTKPTTPKTDTPKQDTPKPDPRKQDPPKQDSTKPDTLKPDTQKPDASKSPPKETPNKMHTGVEFVVLKADIQKGVHPDLWKIDGKSLLQKFEPFQDGKDTFYKNTSIYSGWTLNSRDQYVDAEVDLIKRMGRNSVVRLKLDIASDDVDSD